LVTNKSLFVATSWYYSYLIIKDTWSFEHEVLNMKFAAYL